MGETVFFKAEIEVPPNTGEIVSAEWDFEGEASFPIDAAVNHINEEGSQAVVETTYAFSKPGTFFPVLRASSNREGNCSDLNTQVVNLYRVRVVVHENDI